MDTLKLISEQHLKLQRNMECDWCGQIIHEGETCWRVTVLAHNENYFTLSLCVLCSSQGPPDGPPLEVVWRIAQNDRTVH